MKKNRTKKGITFVEVIIAVFIFVILAVTVAGIFSRGFSAYRKARAASRDAETAQQAINLIAKTLRTSEIRSANASQIVAYDYSRANLGENDCHRFVLSGGALRYSSSNMADAAGCSSGTSGALNTLTTGQVTGVFSYTAGNPGKVTVSLEVCPASGCTGGANDEARVQTSVSLRGGYKEIKP